MRGHDRIIALRLRGGVPSCGVHVATDDADSHWPAVWQKLCRDLGMRPSAYEVHIGQAENLRTLDLRFAIGIDVQVTGMLSIRVHAVVAAFTRAGARTVRGLVSIPKGRESEVIEVIDGAGGALWLA